MGSRQDRRYRAEQVSAGQLRHALPVGIACVQNAYSLLDRSAEPVLELGRQHDID